MVDEAHERSLSSDILLGMLKKIRQKRQDLKIVISSATLQAESFLNFFIGANAQNGDSTATNSILSLPGRMYPVDIEYLQQPAEDYLERAVQTIFDIHSKEDEGDILVFLTGRDEIDSGLQAIADRALNLPPSAQRITALPLFAGLPQEEQMEVFEPVVNGSRKVILATNIAEASVTVDGIVYVVDCGFVKLRAYNPTTSIETLTATLISKASATQRAGRAGRTKPGKCFRLYTEDDYNKLPEAAVPEVQRSDLAPTILQLKALGIDNIARFDFFTPPPAELVLRALELLYSLGALDEYAKLTRPLGTRMAELAVEPMVGKVLLTAPKFHCLSEILSISAMTSLQGSVWFTHDGEKKAQQTARHKFAAEEGDHLTLLNVYQTFVTSGKKDAQWCKKHHLNYKNMTRAVSIRNQLKRYLEHSGIAVDESLSSSKPLRVGGPDIAEQIRRCLTTGLFAHAAKMQPDGTFKTVNGGTTLHAHPSSLMFNRKAEWVIFQQVVETSAKTFIRDITKIERDWLAEYAPDFYSIR